MPTLLRLSLPLSTDFGNAEPSTQGLSCAQASDIGAPSSAKLKHQSAVEIEPENRVVRFTRRVPHGRLDQSSITH
jgi:hypothetical protein